MLLINNHTHKKYKWLEHKQINSNIFEKYSQVESWLYLLWDSTLLTTCEITWTRNKIVCNARKFSVRIDVMVVRDHRNTARNVNMHNSILVVAFQIKLWSLSRKTQMNGKDHHEREIMGWLLYAVLVAERSSMSVRGQTFDNSPSAGSGG